MMMKYSIQSTTLFKKNYKKVLKQGKSKEKIEKIISDLADFKETPVNLRPHKLKGKFKGMCEIHIEPNLLLVYEYYHPAKILWLMSIGSHSELFG